jgi:rhodanese-related sulfurtransferase
MSPDSARRAEAAGYTKVKVFHDGLPAWKKGGNLIVSEPAALKVLMEKDIAHVIVDIRDVAAAEKGFIPGAVSIPSAELAQAKDKFPADKSAPVILCGEHVDGDAFKTVRGWGYKDSSVLNGGIAAWTKDGGRLEKGRPGTVISYVPKPRPGEISIEEFKAIAEKGSPAILILDVRDTDEAMTGMLIGAVNIPAGQIAGRLKDLPKDKEIVTHCVTGLRAESAYDELKAAGYKVRFLNAIIQIDSDGRYEITKK